MSIELSGTLYYTFVSESNRNSYLAQNLRKIIYKEHFSSQLTFYLLIYLFVGWFAPLIILRCELAGIYNVFISCCILLLSGNSLQPALKV